MEGMMQQNRMNRRLLIFPTPFQGHVTPMLHLAHLLHSKGFSITIIQTPYNALNPDKFPHFTFRFLDDGLVETYAKAPPSDAHQVLSDMNVRCLEPFKDCLSQILSETIGADQEPVACLIADPVWKFVGSIADTCKVPRMVVRTGGITSLVVYESLSSLRDKGYFPLKDSMLDEPVPELAPIKFRDLPSEAQHEIMATVVREIKTSQGVICSTFEELEASSISRAQQVLSIPVFPIGPIHKCSPTSTVSILTEDQTSIAWLNTQAPKSVLYVSFGSVAAMNKAEFLEIAWGLANSMQPFLWVVRDGLIQDSEGYDPLAEGYLDMVNGKGHIVNWAPQMQVLSHPAVGGFWTHCGWNSTLESICEGVPMLCLPFFADQATNARHISENWQIGLWLEKGMKREEIKRAIRKLMVEEEGEAMRTRITALKEKSSTCLLEGGSSYKSLDRLIAYLSGM